MTGADPYFVRFWFEPNWNDIGRVYNGVYPKYAYMQKGGTFRKWYGNNEYVLKLADMYDDSKVNASVRRGDSDYYSKRYRLVANWQ